MSSIRSATIRRRSCRWCARCSRHYEPATRARRSRSPPTTRDASPAATCSRSVRAFAPWPAVSWQRPTPAPPFSPPSRTFLDLALRGARQGGVPMKREAWLVLVSLAVSCSSRDQSLGETRPSPQPIIDVEPQPDPTIPILTRIPIQLRASPPARTPPSTRAPALASREPSVPVPPITHAGYECEGDAVCCDPGVGCGTDGCATGGSAMSQGGAGSRGARPHGRSGR